MKADPPTAIKKPYQAPKLRIYGGLTEMTKAIGMTGMMDGGVAMGQKKTGA